MACHGMVLWFRQIPLLQVAWCNSMQMEGKQVALSHKAALPPLVSFGLEMSEHFDKCKDLLREPTPLEQEPVLDDDLKFAAASMASHYMGSWQTSERGQSERSRSWAADGIQSPTT